MCLLDGVEALSGVFIIAVSSRPDLIDPAILRPGRIDAKIFCGLPDESERVQILKVFRSLNLQLKTADSEERLLIVTDPLPRPHSITVCVSGGNRLSHKWFHWSRLGCCGVLSFTDVCA